MSLRMALLGLLVTEGPASGYALTKSFTESLSHVWSTQHSQVYPELARMADAGLVTVEKEGFRGQKRYTATAAGQEELRRWLTEVPPHRPVRNEIALRAFLMPTLPREKAVEFVRNEAEYHRGRLAELTALRDSLEGPHGPDFGYYAAELGVRISAAIEGWAEWAVEHLEDGQQPDPADTTHTPSDDTATRTSRADDTSST